MRFLLDTHVWVQRAGGEPLPRLVEETLEAYSDELAIADISIWEVSKLVELGRLEFESSLADFFASALSPELAVLPITAEVAEHAGGLEETGFHKDPADQLIVGTALAHGLRLISHDARIRQWGRVPMMWKTSRG